MSMLTDLSACRICPRNCGANRRVSVGYCGVGAALRVSRAALHHWEEPCISGTKGSGTVFFAGCSLKCIFCQNHDIALGNSGKDISPKRLEEIFFELKDKGAHNINLVTPTHYIPVIAPVLRSARDHGLDIPVVYNSGGYEKAEALGILEGLVDIYMPDFKYYSEVTSKAFSAAPDYPDTAGKAIAEMYRQCPKAEFTPNGMMKKGVIIRHMLLPGHVYEAKQIMKYLYSEYGNTVVYSLMSQYTPMKIFDEHPELSRRVRKREYDSLLEYCLELGIENAYIQEGNAALESFIPSFDNEGV